jgi:uncharacterized membrane protein YhfC
LRIGTIVAFAISLLVQVGYPLAAMLVFRRRTHAPWRIFAFGALIFAAFQLFTWLPLSYYLDIVIGTHLRSDMGAFVWLLALALLTSLVEEAGRWCGYRYLFRRERFALSWRNGVAFGLGHASLEGMLFIAGLTFIYLVAYIAIAGADMAPLLAGLGAEASPELHSALLSIAHTSWDQPILVALERVLAVPHQVAWSLLVMSSLVYRQKRWFGFAVLYHTSIAVIVPGLARLAGFAWAEGVNTLLAALSLWIIYRLYTVIEGSA